ncbi:MAG TPA: triphosphoribosyl-dephospho-CoA synthase [Planctomycetota bacterium]|nr:triphosphoribosyl-dephospho-CoA synthase [Planctomycetota bacterium]
MPTPAENPRDSDAPSLDRPSIGTLAQIACLLDVAAPKAGNVHARASFRHLAWLDFAVAGAAIAPILDRASSRPLGATILDCVRASRSVTPDNANLGIVLALAPLAAVARDEELQPGVERVLASLGPEDARDVYEAIRLANPKGLGSSAEADVHGPAPNDLIAAMRIAMDRDRIARQYVTAFADVFDPGLVLLRQALGDHPTIEEATVRLQLELLSRFPDTHIARRCGGEIASEASRRAGEVLSLGWPASEEGARAFASLDIWLRADDNHRNPGTTADLIAAILFAGLRDGSVPFPLRTTRDPSR